MHSASTKMCRNLRHNFWWPGLKKGTSKFIAKCLTYQQAKLEYQRTTKHKQPLSIPKWKWEKVIMDFMIGLPISPKGSYTKWMIVDRLTNSMHSSH